MKPAPPVTNTVRLRASTAPLRPARRNGVHWLEEGVQPTPQAAQRRFGAGREQWLREMVEQGEYTCWCPFEEGEVRRDVHGSGRDSPAAPHTPPAAARTTPASTARAPVPPPRR